MDFINILIVGSAIFVIILLWIIVGVRHLNRLKTEVNAAWEFVDERIRKRHNLIPNLIETVRSFDDKQEPLMQKLIQERAHAVKEYFPSAKKIELEYDLSYALKELLTLSKHKTALATDTNFLELTTEIRDAQADVEKNLKIYNNKVRLYNKHKNKFILRPLAWAFRQRVANIFEVEMHP